MSKLEKKIYIGTINGRKKYRHIRANTERELKTKEREIIAQREQGKNLYEKAYFGEWAEKWLLEKEASGKASEAVIREYRNEINRLNERYEHTELKDIKRSDFQAYINQLAKEPSSMTGKPLSKATLKKIVKTASNVFQLARADDVPAGDFFKTITVPESASKKDVEALTEEQINMIVNTPHRAQPYAMIMLFAGLRRGEVAPLKWSDINLDKNYIHVSRSADMAKNPPTIREGGKTKNADRYIPICPALKEYLIQYRTSQKILSPYVVTSARGEMYNANAFRRLWESYMYDLNVKYGYPNKDVSKYDPSGLPMRIEKFNAHQLRHTFATFLYLQNIDFRHASEYLGHNDVQITMNIYTSFKQLNYNFVSKEFKEHLETDYRIEIA